MYRVILFCRAASGISLPWYPTSKAQNNISTPMVVIEKFGQVEKITVDNDLARCPEAFLYLAKGNYCGERVDEAGMEYCMA